MVIERDGSLLPDTTNTLTIYDVLNAAIKKPLLSVIEFTTNSHVLLGTKDNKPASLGLKNHRSGIEKAIRATISTATSLRKDDIWYKVILHSISTSTTFNIVQCEDIAGSAMVLTISDEESTYIVQKYPDAAYRLGAKVVGQIL